MSERVGEVLADFIERMGFVATIDDKLIGQRIQAARKRCKMTQAEAAAQLGMSDSYYARLEQGKVRINLNRMFDLCCLYKVNISMLLKQCCKEFQEDYPENINPVVQKMINLMDKSTDELSAAMYAICLALYENNNGGAR